QWIGRIIDGLPIIDISAAAVASPAVSASPATISAATRQAQHEIDAVVELISTCNRHRPTQFNSLRAGHSLHQADLIGAQFQSVLDTEVVIAARVGGCGGHYGSIVGVDQLDRLASQAAAGLVTSSKAILKRPRLERPS